MKSLESRRVVKADDGESMNMALELNVRNILAHYGFVHVIVHLINLIDSLIK